MIVVDRFDRVWDTNVGRFDGGGNRVRRLGRMAVGMVPPRRAGRKAVQIAISMGVKW